ncbi:peptidase S15 [Catenulispora acidiphila DSM 44928]|uniref:Peptidase S15 n=1 Tax=Catenulispora acidiphila (strain DSM 44928 / JCM 14897 / NBRC 102108 / NRRL B-24433 / ID139908) TaxID=479433 RepID=C7PWN1_CATAD|nr:alpha/beta fold hydrolase [Catenulispora acidiphila]ACU75311.1 peptidase S15 [Catenulispora acidiphila DSM 44928]
MSTPRDLPTFSFTRTDVTFTSGNDDCAAWLYRPDGDQSSLPCVILAHGLGATRAGRLDAFAERFAAAGFNALVFDYRYFGDSTGEPRCLLSVKAQLQDWRAAIGFARSLPGIDRSRIALWGTSFSGGHVTLIAAQDPAIAAVISMNPFLDGRTSIRSTPPRRALALGVAGLRDLAHAALRRPPYLVPAIGDDGDTAAMASREALEGFLAMFPADAPPSTDISARILLRLGLHRPVTRAARVACPWLLQAGTTDTISPAGPARRAAARAPNAQMSMYDGGHFAPYVGAAFEQVVTEQVRFLTRHLQFRT